MQLAHPSQKDSRREKAAKAIPSRVSPCVIEAVAGRRWRYNRGLNDRSTGKATQAVNLKSPTKLEGTNDNRQILTEGKRHNILRVPQNGIAQRQTGNEERGGLSRGAA